MDKTRFILTGITAVLFGVAMGWAGEGAAPAEKKAKAGGGKDAVFATADTNVDGVLALDEFTTMEAKRLEARKARQGDKFDAAKAAKMPTPEARFKKLDKDASGTLTKEEFFAGAAAKPRPERKAKAAQEAAAGAVQ